MSVSSAGMGDVGSRPNWVSIAQRCAEAGSMQRPSIWVLRRGARAVAARRVSRRRTRGATRRAGGVIERRESRSWGSDR